MSRRILIVEPDAAGRAMMDRVLTADGFAADTAATAIEARGLLDAGLVEAAVVDELAGSRGALEEVRWLRSRYPTVPLVVTGALLSRRVMQELLRLRVADALAKPFTPAELREAVGRAVEQRTEHREEALEYAASLTDARRAIAAGVTDHARAPLARAQATSPFDTEIMALYALLAELAGRDAEADRGYRAALALRDGETAPTPNPHEGLARLAAYGATRPVSALDPARREQPIWVISEPARELRGPSAVPTDRPHVVVLSLGLTAEDGGATFYRDGPVPRAFALLACSLRADSIAAALASVGDGEIHATDATLERLDLARIQGRRSAAKGKS